MQERGSLGIRESSSGGEGADGGADEGADKEAVDVGGVGGSFGAKMLPFKATWAV
jgi:hypothetical protein